MAIFHSKLLVITRGYASTSRIRIPWYPVVSHDEWLIGSPKVQQLELLLPRHRAAAAVDLHPLPAEAKQKTHGGLEKRWIFLGLVLTYSDFYMS